MDDGGEVQNEDCSGGGNVFEAWVTSVDVLGTWCVYGETTPWTQAGVHCVWSRPAVRSSSRACGHGLSTELLPGQICQSALNGGPVELLRGEGAEKTRLIVPVDPDTFDGRIGVGLVSGQRGWRLADAYDHFVRDGVELDATAVESLGGEHR